MFKFNAPIPLRLLLGGLLGLTLPRIPVWSATLTVGHGGGFDHSSLTSAVSAARAGDTILLASGVYNVTSGESFPIQIKPGLRILSSDPGAFPALDGNGLSGVLWMKFSDNARLEGVRIRGGSAEFGGGLSIISGRPEIVNCDFEENMAIRGGGLYSEGSSPQIEGCTFAGNRSLGDNFWDGGGGAYCSEGAPKFQDCHFVQNTGIPNGSGAGLTIAGDGSVVRCQFLGNTGVAFGGGAYLAGTVVVSRCLFVENTARFWGGGAYMWFSDSVFENCEFYRNRAFAAADGSGGLVSDGSGLQRVRACTFVGNTGSRGGGVICFRGSTAEIENCLFAGNFSPHGGAIACTENGTNPFISFCTFFRNRTFSGTGGGLANLNSARATLSSCLFADNNGFDIVEANPTGDVAAENCLFFGNPTGVYLDEGSNSYDNVAEAQAAIPEFNNNLEGDPLFLNSLSGQWTSDPAYSETEFQTVLRDGCANWAENQFVDRAVVLNPNIAQQISLFSVASNTRNELRVWGNATAPVSKASDTYQFYDLRTMRGSPIEDSADIIGPTVDLLGRPRPLDVPGVGRDGSGDEFDIGAIEFQDGPSPTPSWTPLSSCDTTPTPTPSSAPTASPTPTRACDFDIVPPGGDGRIDARDLLELLKSDPEPDELTRFARCWQGSQ